MPLFRRKEKIELVPQGCENLEIRTQSSICTGETVIGFYDPVSRELRCSQLVRTPEEAAAFCARYGRTLGK